jgi:hypothetical protein
MLYLIYIAVPLVALLPIFVKKNPERPHSAVIISWIIVGILFVVAANFLLIDLASQIERNHVANCPSGLINHDSTFGNRCTSPIVNPIEKAVVDNFGGPFSGLYVMLIGIPAVFILSIIGFVIEIKNTKKKNQMFWKAIWSTSFLVLISSFIFILAGFVV